MKLIKNIACVSAFAAIAVLSQSTAAQAFSFKVTAGTAGLNGETDRGAFSEHSKMKNTTIIDFDNGKAPTTGFAKYSFQNSSTSSVRFDRWAPAGANGEVNKTNYMAVFAGDAVTIQLEKTLNYFGIDWGAISSGNVFTFFKGNEMIKSYSTDDINPVAPVKAAQHGGEGNGFVHFYAESAAEIFDRIVITQTGGGGFESDNHTFHAGTSAFTTKDVPEPGVALGLLALGGAVVARRKRAQKTV
jgi:PEP-CTERM motif